MFASMSYVLRTEMVPHLEVIIKKMVESLRSSEGVKVCEHSNFFESLGSLFPCLVNFIGYS